MVYTDVYWLNMPNCGFLRWQNNRIFWTFQYPLTQQHFLNQQVSISKCMHLHMKWISQALFYENKILIIAFLWSIWLGMTWSNGIYLNENLAIGRTLSREGNHCYQILRVQHYLTVLSIAKIIWLLELSTTIRGKMEMITLYSSNEVHKMSVFHLSISIYILSSKACN
jgi:hypothetical protein